MYDIFQTFGEISLVAVGGDNGVFRTKKCHTFAQKKDLLESHVIVYIYWAYNKYSFGPGKKPRRSIIMSYYSITQRTTGPETGELTS
jgi:hypothetical protein